MLGLIATMKIQPDKGAEFEAAFKDMAAQVKANEKGCLTYQLTKSRTEPDTYKVLELYVSEDDLKHHVGTDYFKAGGAKLGPFMAGRPTVEYLDAIE